MTLFLIHFTSGSRWCQGRKRRRWWSWRVCKSENNRTRLGQSGIKLASRYQHFHLLPTAGIPWTSRWKRTPRPTRKEGKVTISSKNIYMTTALQGHELNACVHYLIQCCGDMIVCGIHLCLTLVVVLYKIKILYNLNPVQPEQHLETHFIQLTCTLGWWCFLLCSLDSWFLSGFLCLIKGTLGT